MSPADVVRSLHALVAARDWSGAAKLYHPAVAEHVAQTALGFAAPEPPTLDAILESDPDMPQAVAEYYLERSLRVHEVGIERFQFDDRSLPVVELLGRLIKFNDYRVVRERWITALRSKYPQHSESILEAEHPPAPPTPLGELHEIIQGDVGCVVEVPADGELRPHYPVDGRPRVWMLRHTADGWRLSQDPIATGYAVALPPLYIRDEAGETVKLSL